MATSAWVKAVLCGVVAAGGGSAAYKAGQRDGARIEAARAQAKAQRKPRPRPPATAVAAPRCPVCTCPVPPAATDPADLVRFLPWVLPPQPQLAAPGGGSGATVARGAARTGHGAVAMLALGGGWGGGGASSAGSAGATGPAGMAESSAGGAPGGGPGALPLGPEPPPLLALPPGTPFATAPQPIPAPPGAALLGLGATLLLAATLARRPPRR